MTIESGEVLASAQHGSKQRAPVVLTKAPPRGRSLVHIQRNVKAFEKSGPMQGKQAVLLGPAALRLIEEEKKAVRRHRKRLARIVVDQWRYYAGKALLTLDFQRRVLDRRKRQCWDAWRAAVSKRRLKWTKQARAEARRRLFLERQVLLQWKNHVQKQKKYQEAAVRLLWMDVRRTYKIAFDALRAHQAASQLKRQANESAYCYWRLSTLSRCLQRWRYATKVGQEGMAQRVKALQHWSAWRKGMAFRVWWQVCLTQKEHRRVSEILRERQESRHKRKTLLLWQQALAAKREDDAKVDKAYSFQYMRLVKKALRHWTVFLELQKERRLEKTEATEMAARHADQQLERRGLKAWQLYLKGQRRKRKLLDAANAESVQRMKRLAVKKWRSYLQSKRDKEARTASARQVAERQLKGRVMLALKSNLQRKRRKEQHAIVVGRHWVRHIKRMALAKWRIIAMAARSEREATEEMLEEKKMVIVRAWQREYHLSKGLYSWQLYVDAQRHSRSQHSKAARFLRAKLLGKALAGFRIYSAQRKRKQERNRIADEAFRRALLHRVLLVCWQEALSRRRAKREAYRRAVSLRNSRLQRVSLEVWRVCTARWALKSAAMRRAALHHEAALLKRGLCAWTRYRERRRKKQQAEDERVQGFRRELGILVAGRVLVAWVEQHNQWLIRKLKVTRARNHFREVYESRGLRVWRVWLSKQRAKHRNSEMAERLCRQLLMKRAVAAWKAYLGAVQGKKEHDARALKQWSVSLQRRTMQAWTSYLAKRRFKSVSMTSAERLYQTHLVDKTASHWLAKARRRQQLRLQIALEKQALTSIAQLARVAPFARRWLHLARKRREEREGGRHRARLDGWAVRNVSATWRNLSKTRPPNAYTGNYQASGFGRGSGMHSFEERRSQSEATLKAADSVRAASNATVHSAEPRSFSPLRERAFNVVVDHHTPPSSLPEASRPDRQQVCKNDDVPVGSVVERITASIASGASVLEALPPWARAHSRPPPRRPVHLLTAGLPDVKRRLTAGNQVSRMNASLESAVRSSMWAEEGTHDQAGPNRVSSSSEAKGAFGKSTVDSVPLDRQRPAEQLSMRTQGFALAEPLSQRSAKGDAPREGERSTAPQCVRPREREADGSRSTLIQSKVAVRRQLVLGDDAVSDGDIENTETAGMGAAQTTLETESHTAALLKTSGRHFVTPTKISEAEDIRPASAGGLCPSSRLTLDPRIVAQEVTWMEHVLREFDGLKLESLKCSAELGTLRGVPGRAALVATGVSTSDFAQGVETPHDLRYAERIWELEQRHAALELRKKLQLPMVRAVAERVKRMASEN